MHDIEKRFAIESDKDPDASTITLFVRCIRGQRLRRKEIDMWLELLVDHGDYQERGTEELLDFLVKCSNS